MKFSDIKDLTVEELRKRLEVSRGDLFDMKMKHSLGQVGNPLEIRSIRKGIAKINTALKQKLAQ
ncbi:MAG: 50S ribosomal protein L29 [Bdellovibrionaceae bacterium]|jgi:large subunit ribosomal protein L29|nr:50S ribosomal protein L29 [Pseudobdellovibrionaceae bacterium]